MYRGDGLNLYAYCDNNPVVYWDPSGYAKKPCDAKDVVGKQVEKNANRERKSIAALKSPTRMTTKQATEAAKKLGYEPTKHVAKSGERVFYNKKTKTYISQDVGSGNGMGSHNGGVWKAAKSPEGLMNKETRLGTYDANLNRIGD